MRNIVGFFTNRQDAENAVNALLHEGIPRENLGFVVRDHRETDAPKIGPVHETGGSDTTAGETAVIGGLAGFVAGLVAVAIPGLGLILVAGPLAGALAGAGIGAAAGGLIGYLRDAGVSEEEAEYYSEGIRRGGAVVFVRCQDEQHGRVSRILEDNGATDINKHAEEWRAAGWKGFDPDAEPLPYTRRA
jgi:hypothetical protein